MGNRQRIDDPADGQRLHDDAGRKRKNLPRRAIENRRDGRARLLGCGNAGRAGAGVGVSRVDDDRADFTGAGEMAAAHRDRRSGKPVPREDAGRHRSGVERREQQIVTLPVLDLRGRRA